MNWKPPRSSNSHCAYLARMFLLLGLHSIISSYPCSSQGVGSIAG
ncbi:unnamed protein product [Acidithrix sp. C25]|nr:unnamed protein product [Acidithrix sp. C25]